MGDSHSHCNEWCLYTGGEQILVRFSLCVDERGSFKVVCYLLRNARESQREKKTHQSCLSGKIYKEQYDSSRRIFLHM